MGSSSKSSSSSSSSSDNGREDEAEQEVEVDQEPACDILRDEDPEEFEDAEDPEADEDEENLLEAEADEAEECLAAEADEAEVNPAAEADEAEENPGNDNRAANNRRARGGARSRGPARTPTRTKSLTVLVAVKESLHTLRWTIANIIRQSESSRRQAGAAWPWSSNTSEKKLVAVHSAHTHFLVTHMATNKYTRRALDCVTAGHQCVTAGASSIRAEVENISSPIAKEVKDECRRKNVQVKTIEMNGDPRLTLFRAVEQHRADILVLGGHNYSDIRRLLLGSVADTFVDYCRSKLLKCHLVVVHKKSGQISVHSPR